MSEPLASDIRKTINAIAEIKKSINEAAAGSGKSTADWILDPEKLRERKAQQEALIHLEATLEKQKQQPEYLLAEKERERKEAAEAKTLGRTPKKTLD